jgi:hypothetical protein
VRFDARACATSGSGIGAKILSARRRCDGQRDRHAFERMALRLPIQLLMLAEPLDHDRGRRAWAGPSARDGVEWRSRLADLLAVTAAETLNIFRTVRMMRGE